MQNQNVTPTGRRPCVLVADDDEDARALIATMMRRSGYDVIEACDGREVVHLMSGKRRLPDLIVTDVRMPNVSGLSLLVGLRKEGCMVPIVLITAYGVEHVRGIAERLGANAVMAKPLEADALTNLVMNVMH